MKFTLSEEEIRKFNEKGFLIIKGLYKNYPYIEKIKSDINFISKLILKKNYTTMNVSDFTEFDSIYKYLLAIDKKKASLIYDAIKLLPFFNKWSHCDLHYTLSSTLLKSKLIGFCRTGDGIRADAPDNNFYAFPHQEFSAQGRSEQGLVFWSPLINMKRELGPVKIWERSHKLGVLPVGFAKNKKKITAYDIILKDKKKFLSGLKTTSPLLSINDLLIMHFLTVHSSNKNISTDIRWSLQTRFFKFEEIRAIDSFWKKVNLYSYLPV